MSLSRLGISNLEHRLDWTLVRYTDQMTVIVNGEEKNCPEGTSLAKFVELLQLKGDRVAVELNRRIAARNLWSEIVLQEGDRLEIVHFVGGGRSDITQP